RQNQPDFIVSTGDFLEWKLLSPCAVENAARFMRSLHSRLGTFAIAGNHDTDLLAARAATWNLELLDRRRVTLRSPDAAIELIGLPGVNRFDLDDSFLLSIPPPQPRVPRIVLSHFPDHIKRIAMLRTDLVLAGHTHGGQCCLPGGVPILTHDSLPRRYAKGIHRLNGTWLIVARGLGFASLPMRVFCSSEVVEVALEEGD